MTMSIMTIRDALLHKGLHTFTARELEEVLKLSPRRTLYYLEKGQSNGLLTQLKRGLYCLKTDPPSELEIANRLYRPSYVSFEYALAHYNILPEMVYVITSATTKPTREFNVGEKTYRFTTIKKSVYTGHVLIISNQKLYLMAEPEKALTDYLYTVCVGRRAMSERLTTSSLDRTKVNSYAKLFSRPSLIQLI